MSDTLSLTTDVLVIGGGLAAAWAGVAAARSGARVVMVDKGHCGTSGVTATAGPGRWWVPPKGREAAVADRLKRSLRLGDPDWMRRILDLTWTTLPTLRGYYDFASDDHGQPYYRGLGGPEYMRHAASGRERGRGDLGSPSGLGEHAEHFANQHWRMGSTFERARLLAIDLAAAKSKTEETGT